MNECIKKYVIHILAVTAISEDVFDIHLENCAMVTLTTRTRQDDYKIYS